ncbi:MAG: amidinotransferase [Planctomycetes bacterium]|nr:amidinotransferase [Planctomycetota bacterium]
MGRVVTDPSEVAKAISSAPPRPPCARVLMAAPEHFSVESAINPWMHDAQGNLNQVDRARAQAQWEALADAYRRIGVKVDIIDAPAGLPDFCFSANQSLTCLDRNGQPLAIMSRMASPTRFNEVTYFRDWYAQRDFRVMESPPGLRAFEGTGDAIRHHGRHVFWGGVGPRTMAQAWEFVGEATGADVIPLTLVDERYYHLDTCLAIMGPDTALYIEEAFDEDSRKRLQTGFTQLIAVDPHDAGNFACNAHCPDDRHVLIQHGSRVAGTLREAGFEVLELDTSEFMKSGGSVFCLKQELP